MSNTRSDMPVFCSRSKKSSAEAQYYHLKDFPGFEIQFKPQGEDLVLEFEFWDVSNWINPALEHDFSKEGFHPPDAINKFDDVFWKNHLHSPFQTSLYSFDETHDGDLQVRFEPIVVSTNKYSQLLPESRDKLKWVCARIMEVAGNPTKQLGDLVLEDVEKRMPVKKAGRIFFEQNQPALKEEKDDFVELPSTFQRQ